MNSSFQFARRRDFTKHSHYMTGSYILTNSAILLRLFSYINNTWQLIPGNNDYVIISMLSWLPGLLIFELVYASRRNLQRR